ncbi:diacylglycerol/lipid kinase family protein [Pseudonocardia lutea]|uniref:Diacylglycerol/lipid kinase family protein n=1 Tax=Pseudonocardia lutea TaxID=2172015 RepID=A0ABW1I8J8_9PSEU
MVATAEGAQEAARPGARRRLAAAAALLAALAAIALVVVALLQNPLRLAAAPLLVGVAVAAGWTALVRRGAWRIAACAVALLALVGVVLLVVTASVLRTVVVVVLVLVAAGLARVALGRDLVPEPSGLRPVPAAGHGVLLMNPRSGGGKVARFGLEEECLRRGVTPVVLEPGDDLRALAEAAVAEGADVLGMAGGDGSQALVADVARRHDLPLVVVPAGTRNHFALDLGLDRDDVVAALDAFGAALERRIDLAVLGDRVFVNNASLGVYAGVVQSEGYRDAKLATTARMAPDLLGPGAEGSHLRFRGPDGAVGGPAAMVLVSNGDYRLDRLDGFGTRARLDGGVLGVVTVRVEKGRDVTEMLAAQATGRLRSFHGYRQWSAPEFEVDSDKPLVEVGVDGEALRLPPPLRFRVLPGALRVRVPATSPGAAPAAVAPAGPAEAVAGLVRVLGGHPAQRRTG